MKSFDKITCQKLRADLNAVLAKYGAAEGITFRVGNMRFSPNEVRITSMTATIKDSVPTTVKALEPFFATYGLLEVNAAGDRLVEYKRRNYAYPFIYLDGRSGRRFKCSAASAKLRFAKP